MKWLSFSVLFLALTHSAYADPCRLVTNERNAAVHDCAGVHVVHLRGTPVERAHRLGELVRAGTLSGDVLRYFTGKVSDIVADGAGWAAGPVDLAYNQLVRLFHRGAPAALAEEIDAMAAAMRVDPIVLRRGLSLPDTGVLIQGLGSYPGLRWLPATGCTSAATPLAGGGFAYGRNLDFAGVGVWDRHPMLLVAEPEPGSKELKHIVIGADGLPFGGITGVNEAGLTFAVHQNYSSDISVFGVPMVMIGELVLRQARSIDEAVEILRKNRPAILWTFVLTDLNRGEAAAVESSSRVFLVRRSDGKAFAQTNHVLHEEARARENASYGILTNSKFRYDYLLRELPGATGASSLAKLLAYQEDPLGQLSAFHDVLKSETIQTAIFEAHPAQETTLSLSIDPAPASAGRYALFSVPKLLAGNAPSFELRDYVQTPPDKRQRQSTIAEAYRRYFDERQFAESAALLASQRTIDAALFRCVAMAAAERFADSLRLADEALRDPRFTAEPAYIRDSLTQVKLVSLFRLHRDEEARALAQTVVEGKERAPKGGLLEIARRIVNRESVPAWRLDLQFDFFSGDLSGRKDQHF